MPGGLEPELHKHILGVQAQLWTEYMPSPKAVEYMAYPRLTRVGGGRVERPGAPRLPRTSAPGSRRIWRGCARST